MSSLSNPLLLDFPESFESERLRIGAPRYGEGAAMNAAIRESLNELKPWMPWAAEAPTVEASELNVREARLKFLRREDLRLQLFRKDNGEFVGGSGLHRIHWEARKFEIGYWVRTSLARQGYISEAVRAIEQFAVRELGANRLEIYCDARNTASAAVARSCGFTMEGVMRSEALDTSGQLCDTLIFAKVRGIEY